MLIAYHLPYTVHIAYSIMTKHSVIINNNENSFECKWQIEFSVLQFIVPAWNWQWVKMITLYNLYTIKLQLKYNCVVDRNLINCQNELVNMIKMQLWSVVHCTLLCLFSSVDWFGYSLFVIRIGLLGVFVGDIVLFSDIQTLKFTYIDTYALLNICWAMYFAFR